MVRNVQSVSQFPRHESKMSSASPTRVWVLLLVNCKIQPGSYLLWLNPVFPAHHLYLDRLAHACEPEMI